MTICKSDLEETFNELDRHEDKKQGDRAGRFDNRDLRKQGVGELFKSFGYSREAEFARKFQKYLNNQMEKYIKEMEKSLK